MLYSILPEEFERTTGRGPVPKEKHANTPDERVTAQEKMNGGNTPESGRTSLIDLTEQEEID